MDNFSKLRPPDAIRIKVKIISVITNNNFGHENQLKKCQSNNFEFSSASINDTTQEFATMTQSAKTLNNLDNHFVHNKKSYKIIDAKKLFVDPQMTSYDMLYNLIGQAFDIKQDFKMNYLKRDSLQSQSQRQQTTPQLSLANQHDVSNQEEYVSLNNDWDLDAAFLTSSQPYLSLNVELNNSLNNLCYSNINLSNTSLSNDEELTSLKNPLYSASNHHTNDNEWEVISTNEYQKSNQKSTELNIMNLDSTGTSLIALWSSKAADKAMSVFQKAADKAVNSIINGLSRSGSFSSVKSSGTNASFYNNPPIHSSSFSINTNSTNDVKFKSITKQPLGDNEFKNFLDSDGRIVQPQELRQRIFEGGCEPNKRKELWPILLGIFPNSQWTTKQRCEFIKEKSREYEQLKRSLWYTKISKPAKVIDTDDTNKLNILANKIHKDVWRTDRNHKFYAGNSNKNTESLFNILMTYALVYGNNSNGNSDYSIYVQGMTDLLSPLLYVLKDEALAYVCFCSLIKRCSFNFDVFSDKMVTKISLLSCLLKKYDNEFWSYLVKVGADQLLFVYRWLLIECKREFPLDYALNALEVMWSTITPQSEVDMANNISASMSMSNMSTSCGYFSTNNKSCSTSNILSDEQHNGHSNNILEQHLQQQHNFNHNQYQFGRSVSNASSISLRILRQIDPTYTSCSGKEKHQMLNKQKSAKHNISGFLNNNNNSITANQNKINTNNIQSNKITNENNNKSSVSRSGTSGNSSSSGRNGTCNSSIGGGCNGSTSGNDEYQMSTNEDDGFSEMHESTTTTSMTNLSTKNTQQPQIAVAATQITNSCQICHQQNESNEEHQTEHDEEYDNNNNTKSDDFNLSPKENGLKRQQRFRYFSLNSSFKNNNYYNDIDNENNDDDDDDNDDNDDSDENNEFKAKPNSHNKSRNESFKPSSFDAPRKNFFLHMRREKHRMHQLRAKNKTYFTYLKRYKTNLKQFNSIKKYKHVKNSSEALYSARKERSFSIAEDPAAFNNVNTSLFRSLLNLKNLDIDGLDVLTSENRCKNDIMVMSSETTTATNALSEAETITNQMNKLSMNSLTNIHNRRMRKKCNLNLKKVLNEKNCSSPLLTIQKFDELSDTKFSPPLTPLPPINQTTSVATNCLNSLDPTQSPKIDSNITKPKTSRLNSLLKFKIYSKSFDNNTEITQPIANQPIQVIINSPIPSLNSANTSPINPGTHINANNNTESLSVKSSCSTPYLNKPLTRKNSENEIFNGEKKRVSLPTPITIDQQQKIQQEQNQSTNNLIHQNKIHGRLSFEDDADTTDDYYEDETDPNDEELEGEEEDEQLCYSLSRLDNPFLLFMCMALFMEKRNYILKNQLDANDIACYFDKMTRKHDVKSVLNRARHLYTKLYLSKANLFNYIHHAMEIENSP